MDGKTARVLVDDGIHHNAAGFVVIALEARSVGKHDGFPLRAEPFYHLSGIVPHNS
jgi:hypothetical protein